MEIGNCSKNFAIVATHDSFEGFGSLMHRFQQRVIKRGFLFGVAAESGGGLQIG